MRRHIPVALRRPFLGRAVDDRAAGAPAGAAPVLVLTCYGKADCPLCDKAKGPVARAVAAARRPVRVEWVDITSDPALLGRWGERIPVVCAGETVLAEGWIAEGRLRRALVAALAGSPDGGAADGRSG